MRATVPRPGCAIATGSTTSISGRTMTGVSTTRSRLPACGGSPGGRSKPPSISSVPARRARIPAVVHVDGTARPQIVRDDDNPLFAAILRRFRDVTELPVLINTSFNVHEEPIVNRPEECLQALSDGRVDFVVTQQGVYVRG